MGHLLFPVLKLHHSLAKISNLIKSVFSPAQSPAAWAALSQLSLYLRDKQDGRCEMEPSQAKKSGDQVFLFGEVL